MQRKCITQTIKHAIDIIRISRVEFINGQCIVNILILSLKSFIFLSGVLDYYNFKYLFVDHKKLKAVKGVPLPPYLPSFPSAFLHGKINTGFLIYQTSLRFMMLKIQAQYIHNIYLYSYCGGVWGVMGC